MRGRRYGVFGVTVYIVHIKRHIHPFVWCMMVGLGWVGRGIIRLPNLPFLPSRKPSNVKSILAQYHIFASLLVGM
jgi:hypothetical protein